MNLRDNPKHMHCSQLALSVLFGDSAGAFMRHLLWLIAACEYLFQARVTQLHTPV